LFLVKSKRYSNLFDIPKLDGDKVCGIVFVDPFVVCIPCTNSISDMTATEFYLHIVAHDWNWMVGDDGWNCEHDETI
jgi:hypothetical protein